MKNYNGFIFTFNNNYLIKISVISAILSFLIGTIIFSLFYSTELILYAVVGFVFLFFAILINGICFIKNVVALVKAKLDSRHHLATIAILAINIPIALYYYKIAMEIAMYQIALDLKYAS